MLIAHRSLFAAPLLYFPLVDIELISPSDWLKQQVKSVQDYTLVAARSIGNLFTGPRYLADTTQQADLIGWGSLPIVALAGFLPEPR